MNTIMRAAAATLAVLSITSPLAGCKTKDALAEDMSSAFSSAKNVVATCRDCGTVSAIDRIKEKGQATGAGAFLGAVTGAVVGHQIGNGRGNDVATVGGAIAGGIAGNQIEKNVKAVVHYHVTVAMEDGNTRAIDVPDLHGLTVGTKVKVTGDQIEVASR